MDRTLETSGQSGGRWYREKHGYLSIPLYVKENSIIALGARDDDAVYDYADGVTLRVYAVKEGCKAETKIYSAQNEVCLKAAVSNEGKRYSIHVEAEKPCKVALMNVGKPKSASCDYAMEGEAVVLSFGGGAEAAVSFV